MKTNVRKVELRTHEGAVASHIPPEQQLRRSIMACLLWEDTFYESGEDIATRIAELVPQVSADKVASMMIEARQDMHLRHVPLWVACALAKVKKLKAADLDAIIQRADEMTELLSLYWKEGKRPIPAQMKKGLAKAFTKFDDYQLAKYNRDGAIKLKDVAFLCHVKPKNDKQGLVLAKLVNKDFYPATTKAGFPVRTAYGLDKFEALESPDTWEVNLSGGKDV